jgi:hypothetical protein
VPSPGSRKQGSPAPRRSGATVCPKLAAPGNVTVRALFNGCLCNLGSQPIPRIQLIDR